MFYFNFYMFIFLVIQIIIRNSLIINKYQIIIIFIYKISLKLFIYNFIVFNNTY